jgi:two-component system sensor histidine kinase DesK
LAYLAQTAVGISQYSSGAGVVAGYAILVAFACCYLLGIVALWGSVASRFWYFYGAMIGLCVGEAVFAHSDASVMCTFIVVLTVARLGSPASLYVVSAIGLATVFGPALVPSWHSGPDFEAGATIALTGLAMYGFFRVIRGNLALSTARSEVARLAAENERIRIARDLHDLLGHSLTTITVKAALAHRLGHRDPEAALREIAEVEELSRRALSEVRAAVSDYRDVTLAGELASAAEVLRAAGIVADLPLPATTGSMDPGEQKLFGWVLREGLTNVVRHSHASRCKVTIGDTFVDIIDDGVGGHSPSGNGLRGLRERVEAAGGSVEAGPLPPAGWRLKVTLPTSGIVAVPA